GEARPDLYVVLSVMADAGAIPVARHDFGKLAFHGDEDLGTLVLPHAVGQPAVARPGLRAQPGAGKVVRRIRLEDSIVDLAAREVAPIVEELTGLSDLLTGVRFEIVDTFDAALRRMVAAVVGLTEI